MLIEYLTQSGSMVHEDFIRGSALEDAAGTEPSVVDAIAADVAFDAAIAAAIERQAAKSNS